MTTASRRLDRLIARRDRLNEVIAVAERDAEREHRLTVIREFCATACMPSYLKPRRPVAGNPPETDMEHFLTPAQRAELTTDIEAELAAVEKENLDDMLRMQQLERRRDIRRAEAATTSVLTVLRQTFPDVADTIAHAALRFAVAWLGCNHGREFVVGRVESILNAKLDG